VLIHQADHAEPHHKHITKSKIIGNLYNNYTITNQADVRKKLNQLLNKNTLLSIIVPGKFATSTLLTVITRIDGSHIFLEGFQNERFNKDLLMQSTVTVSGNFEGITVNFTLSDLNGHDIDAAFNLKAPLPQTIEWVQRRDARRVKVPINIPVKIQHQNQTECFDVIDISVAGLSYIDQSKNQQSTITEGMPIDCNIILPDKSIFFTSLEIVTITTISIKYGGQINRVGCKIKRVSYQLDTALQRLINQIDCHYQ